MYRIPQGTTAYDCYIVTEAYDIIGKLPVEKIATASPAAMRIWIMPEENGSVNGNDDMQGHDTNKFAEMLDQMLLPGLENAPPAN